MDRGCSCWRIVFIAAVDAVRDDWGLGISPGRKGLGIGELCLVFTVIGLGGVCGSNISSSFVFDIQVPMYSCFGAFILL